MIVICAVTLDIVLIDKEWNRAWQYSVVRSHNEPASRNRFTMSPDTFIVVVRGVFAIVFLYGDVLRFDVATFVRLLLGWHYAMLHVV